MIISAGAIRGVHGRIQTRSYYASSV